MPPRQRQAPQPQQCRLPGGENPPWFCPCSQSMPSTSSAGSSLSTPPSSCRPASCSSSKSKPSAETRCECQEPPGLPGMRLPVLLLRPYCHLSWGASGNWCVEGRPRNGRAWAAGDGTRTTARLSTAISGGPAQGRQRPALALLSCPAPLAPTSQAYTAPTSAFRLSPPQHPAIRPPPRGPTAVNTH